MCQPEWLSPVGARFVLVMLLSYLLTGVGGKGVWENLGKLHHPELQGLVCSLKATVLTSRTPSTMSKAFARWKTWAQQYTEISVFPLKETEFILYMQHVGSTTSSKSAVMEAVNGVSCVQQLAGYPPVSGAPIVGVTTCSVS